MNKGDYGYMNYYKRKHLIAVVAYVIVVAAFVIAARSVDQKIITAILYALGIVLVLPGAKHLVALLVVFPFHTIDEQAIADLDEHTVELSNGLAVYDVTVAGPEMMLYSPYIYLTDDKVYCLVLNETAKVNRDSVSKILNKIVVNAGVPVQVVMVTNISQMNKILEDLEEETECNMDMLEKMKEQILVYNV